MSGKQEQPKTPGVSPQSQDELSEHDLDQASGGAGESFSFDIEQTLNIGSQSTGAGAGKVTFNPFSITRKIDPGSNRA